MLLHWLCPDATILSELQDKIKSYCFSYSCPSAAGGVARPTTPVNTPAVQRRCADVDNPIDALVYELYGLTDAAREIQMVEEQH